MKDKIIRAVLFGTDANFQYPKGRKQTVIFPAKDDREKGISLCFASVDGLILHLINRIQNLEEQLLNKKK